MNKLHIAAKVIEETETDDDEISKLTGRLERVFTSRNAKSKRITEGLAAMISHEDEIELQESARFNCLTVTSLKFAALQ